MDDNTTTILYIEASDATREVIYQRQRVLDRALNVAQRGHSVDDLMVALMDSGEVTRAETQWREAILALRAAAEAATRV